MTKVKICGITKLEDAISALDFGADMLGFNFFVNSPRYIAPDAAVEIIGALPSTVDCVGVFVNEPVEELLKVTDVTGIKAIQLHGDEDFEFVDKLKTDTDAQIIKAFRVATNFQASVIGRYGVDAVLLDAFADDEYGGTGKRFDWKLAETVNALTPRLYLAGGLTPENVSEAIEMVRPYAVDVASGVESSPGIKDRELMEAFIRNAKNA